MIDINEIKIRLAKREDAVAVSDLLNRLGLNLPNKNEIEKINTHWNRLWDNNPYYQQFDEDVLYGWVMEHNNTIVGFFGCFPRVYYYNKKIFPIAIASQWGVEKEYRTFTHLLCDIFFNHHPISTKLVTTAIKPTGRIFEKYNGKRVPDPDLETVYMVPINLLKLITHKYKEKLDNNSILKFAFKAANFLLPWKLQYKLIAKNKRLKEVDVNTLSVDFDKFWERYLQSSKGLIASRSSNILKWYYTGGSRGLTKKVFIYMSETDEIIGYASIIDEPVIENKELKRYKIIDLLAENEKVKQKIIKELVRYSCEQKMDILEFHLPGTIKKNDIPVFTLKRNVPQFPVFFQTSDTEMNKILQEKNVWQILPFDGDTCLG
ncbi:hypothetical protein LK994_04500 [Ferruginibacter lapsinanis]|uniref:hypothetical protein n=1 Tax=Ferruginibacter lapsinanis TaxID=563172 RepID=UPI001E5902D2|nr:hypothetical protein [Ferruginibacter lapsinanis]UEG50732.1 hypothetical protein LK994_04500 [Ferruginibacter lapsinanis]